MNATTSKPVSLFSVALLILLISCSLTGCNSSSSASAASSRMLYQPPILALPAGQPIQTLQGIYRPQVDEVWHSPARFEAIEQANQNLAAALAEERARSR
jgi:hypothetical protein